MKPLWKHQEHAIRLAEVLPCMGLFFEQGCLSRTTGIKVNTHGRSAIYDIETLYRRFNGVELELNQSRMYGNVFVRSLIGDVVGLNKMIGVYRSGEKELVRIWATGASAYLECTLDHKIYTNAGWKRAADITKDDFLAYDGLKKWQRKVHTKKRTKMQYRALVVGSYYPYSYKHGKYRKAWTHRLVYEAHINNITLDEYIGATRRKDFPTKYKTFPTDQYHVHHIDEDSFNNDISNLQLMDKYAHLAHHGDYSHFGHGDVSWKKVTKIESIGKGMTYDIECESPYNSFTANNFVVHNSGKSRAAIEILRRRYAAHGRIRRTLILAPIIVCQNWKEEFAMYSKVKQQDIVVLTKAGRLRERDLINALGQDLSLNKIVITNYEAMQMEGVYSMLTQWRPEVLICDESQRLKNAQGKRAKLVTALADIAEHKYILTGTPILNSPMDIFQQFRILDGGSTFGKNFYSFRATYFRDANDKWRGKQSYYPKWEPIQEKFPQLQDKISAKALRVLKKDCLDLPPLVRQVVYVEMSSEQRRVYNEMKEDYLAFVKSHSGENKAVVAQLAVTKALRLQQIISGFAKDENGVIHRVQCPRLAALEELLETITQASKVIVWCTFKENYAMIKELCAKLSLQWREITGDVSNKERLVGMDEFRKNPDIKVMIANQAAAGVGLNLVEASYSIYYSKNFSLEQDLQSEARNYRGGSEMHEKVTRIDLVARGTIDELITEALAGKQNISDKILGWNL